nr:MAG: CHC2 zinc finger domain-containing protein [Candidatus Methanoperedens sp.]
MSFDVEKSVPSWKAHCKGMYPREFAYKPLPGESILNLVRIHQVRDIDALARMVGAYKNRLGFYVSVYPFASIPGHGKLDYDTAIIDRLYLDFDSADSLDRALNEASVASDVLRDVSIETMSYFSGMKGTACYIDFQPTPIAVENKKEVLGLFWDIINSGLERNYEILNLTTLDRSSVRGDLARVSRLPNTPHHSGLFCIPLTAREMHRAGSYIRAMAKAPRFDIDLDIIIKDNIRINSDVVPRLLLDLEKRVIEIRKENAEKIENAVIEAAKPLPAGTPGKKGGYTSSARSVSDEEVARARVHPIAYILGDRKLRGCPLHDDTVPSLSVNHTKNVWRCFACGRAGGVIQLVMAMEKLSFVEAVRRLNK